MKTMKTLKAPFPAFGGKSKVASMAWERLGDVDNYIEPFCFSAAMLLGRKTAPKTETVNDLNAYVSNFWRAVQSDPDAVAKYADWPVNEVDLHARHDWLTGSDEALESLRRVRSEPEFYDAKMAGWWCWGACCWIGSGWCDESEITSKKLPHLGDAGLGVHKKSSGRVQLADAFSRGRGVNGNDNAETCEERRAWLTGWMRDLSDRLRPVRVCCGHWNRVCDSPSTTTRLGETGVFLDPPYRKTVNGQQNRSEGLYANDKTQDVDALCDEVHKWCLKWQDKLRIALCGLDGEYDLPGWDCVPWKASGGYGNQSGKVNENASRERIWFSPRCLSGRYRSLFNNESL